MNTREWLISTLNLMAVLLTPYVPVGFLIDVVPPLPATGEKSRY